jgi:hypothetical protein
MGTVPPTTATVKEAWAGAVTVIPTGCVVKEMAGFTVRLAALLVTFPPELETRTRYVAPFWPLEALAIT